MDAYEPNAHSFIVKLWIEEIQAESGQIHWRGRVTHVPDGEQRYFEHWESLTAFMLHYLMQTDRNAQPIN